MPNFKRTLVAILVLLLVSFSFSPFVFGKTALENAKDDYTFQFAKYQEAKTNYLQDKSAYEKFKTAISKNEAFVSTKDYLLQISKLYSSHLLLIEERGNEINWSGREDQRGKTLKLVEEELGFLNDFSTKTNSTQTLEELTAQAVNLSSQIQKQTLPKVFKILSIYEIAEAKASLDNLDSTTQVVESYLAKYPSQSQSVISNWRTEIDAIKNSANSSIQRAEQVIAKTAENTAKLNEFQEISLRTNSAKSNLKRSKNLFEEILRLL